MSNRASDITVTPTGTDSENERSDKTLDGPRSRTMAQQASVHPVSRLLSLEQAAHYLGVSTWTVRELEWSGVLPRVRIPLGNGKELRKLLFDREDLDRLIDRWKDSGQ